MDQQYPIDELTDEELDYLLQQHEQEAGELGKLSDEQLERALTMYQAPGGNVDIANAPKFETEEPDLSLGENIAGGVRELAAGATFEFADEAEAAVRSAASGEPYQKVLDEIRQKRALFEQANPATALGLNLAGGIGTTFIPGVNVLGRGVQNLLRINKLASPTKRVVATGAAAGALSGFGSGEDTEDRLTKAGAGFLLGGGLGYGASKAGDVGRFALESVQAMRNKMPQADAVNAATDILIRTMQRAGKTPEEIAERLRLDREYGVNTMLGQADPALVSLTDVSALTPSEGTGRAQLAERLFKQQAGAKTRVQQQIREKIPTPDYFASEDAIAKSLRDIGEEGYEKSFGFGAVKDPTIQTLLKNPGVSGALKKAKETADIAANNAAARGEDPSKYMLKMNMEPVLDEAGNLVGLRPTGDIVPDVRTLHSIKRALDEEITSLYRAGDGGRAEALKETRNQILGRLDKLVPEYREARKLYAGDLEIRDALQFGRQSGKLRPEEFARKFNKFSPGEQEAAKTGLVQDIMDGFSRATTKRNFAQNVVNSDDMMGKLKLVMKPEEYRVFKAALKREAELFGQASRVAQGSATFQRQVAKEDVDEMIEQNADNALELFMNPTPGGVVRAVASAVRRMRNANMSKATFGELSKALSAASDDELASIFARIDERLPGIEKSLAESEARATRGTVAGAAAQAPTPEIDRERLPEEVEFQIPEIEGGPAGGLSVMPAQEPPVAAPEIDPDVAMRQFWADFEKLTPQEQEEFKRYMAEKGGISGTITDTGEPQ
jgi:hypothetical protein